MAKPGASLSFMTELEEMQCSTFSSSSRFRFSETKRPRVLLSTRGLTNKLSLAGYFNLKVRAIKSVWLRMRPNLSRSPLNLSV